MTTEQSMGYSGTARRARADRVRRSLAGLGVAAAFGLAMAGGPMAALAQAPTVETIAAGDAACAGRRVLGVSRVLEIDTARGPRFGHQQYKEHEFLRDHEVVLTFDDGPLRANTKMVLEALASHCTRATFFMVGRMAQSDPDMVREVARRGHTVGTHTYSHANMRKIGAARAQVEIEMGMSAVSRALKQPVAPFFRFPFLADSQAMISHLGQRNVGIFSIDVDAVDYRARDGATVHRTVMRDLLPLGKGILLFHDIQPATAQGLKTVLDDLAAKGFKVVHIVPKKGASTLANFDAQADSDAEARARAAAANPLAQRSVVWPMGTPKSIGQAAAPSGTAPQDRNAASTIATPGSGSPTPATQPGALPGSFSAGQATGSILPPPVAAAPPSRSAPDDEWRRRVFDN